MDENIKESIKKFKLHKKSSIGTFITDLSTASLPQNILKKQNIETCIFNLKKHHNNLLFIKKENQIEINKLLNLQKKYEKLIISESQLNLNGVISDEDNDLDNEIDSEHYKKKIDYLSRKKEENNKKLKDESEYTNNLLNMIMNEKTNLKNSDDNYNENKDKLRKINLTIKNIHSNIRENSIKSKNLDGMNKGLNSKINRMHDLIKSQKKKGGYLSFSLDNNNLDILKKKKDFFEKFTEMEKDIQWQKKEISFKIAETEKMKIKKLNNENTINRIILGLDLIKRYLIEAEKLDKRDISKSLLETEDYAYFKNAKFIFLLNEDERNSQYKINAIKKEDEMYSKKHLDNLKEKFDKLDINYDEILNLFTKYTNKQQFSKDYIEMFNAKQIVLESKKEKYSKRVSEIVSKTHHNIGILEIKSKFKEKLNIVENDIYEIKKFDFELIDNNKSYYKKCEVFIQTLNSFLDFLLPYFEFPNINQFKNDITIFKEAEEKIKQYFKNLSFVEEISHEKLINKYFEDYSQSNKMDFNKILQDFPKYDFEKYNNEYSINEENKYIKFAHLNKFISTNKKQFLSLNICKIINYKVMKDKIQIFERIIEILKPMIKKYIYKCLQKLNTIDDSHSSIDEEKKRNAQLNWQSIILKRSDSEQESYISDIHHDNIVKKKKTKILNKKMTDFLEKVYNPYVEKHKYMSCLNEGIVTIKRNTRKNIVENHILNKKQDQINKISNEMLLYNNPNINLNILSNNTYNSFVKNIISTQVELNKGLLNKISTTNYKLLKSKSTNHYITRKL